MASNLAVPEPESIQVPAHESLYDLETGNERNSLDGPDSPFMYDSHVEPSIPAGDYDKWMEHLKLLAQPVFASVAEALMFAMPTPQEREYIMRLLALGNYQFTAECSWWEVYVQASMPDRSLLERATNHWRSLTAVERYRLPLTWNECREELSRLEQTIREVKTKIAQFKALGHLWSAKPLMDFMALDPVRRQGHSFEHFLPPLHRKAIEVIYSAMPSGIGFAHRQALTATQLMDIWQASNFQRITEPSRAKGLFRPPPPSKPAPPNV